ncbi:hypothetical protein KLP40_08375 [Hymenobacter sp. NST-14]|uniref:T-complex 10 C-terminal domain-containing protein n=1 Tax=Hymenobacter piscis TaxID=2839984 RepID=UPI001C012202|nr:T-complex 10 C-terminal domain-containing protein [Hymenobacter piscis]MBT9393178.1 hypothetical protein [Hymenobacter piscis]
MHKSLLLFSAAASLAVVSCNQDKQAAVDAATTPSADTAVVVDDDMAYRADADRVITRVANDLDLRDTTVVSTIGRTYYTRGRRLAEVNNRYTTDTTGRYAALRAVNDETDNAVKMAVSDEQYNTYSANREVYYEGTPYTVVAVREPAAAAPARRTGPSIVKYDKKKNGETKIVYSNGKTVKIDKDGDTKVEYPNGTKVKRDADDGEVKVKR